MQRRARCTHHAPTLESQRHGPSERQPIIQTWFRDALALGPNGHPWIQSMIQPELRNRPRYGEAPMSHLIDMPRTVQKRTSVSSEAATHPGFATVMTSWTTTRSLQRPRQNVAELPRARTSKACNPGSDSKDDGEHVKHCGAPIEIVMMNSNTLREAAASPSPYSSSSSHHQQHHQHQHHDRHHHQCHLHHAPRQRLHAIRGLINGRRRRRRHFCCCCCRSSCSCCSFWSAFLKP